MFSKGDKVKARICSTPLGSGEIVEITTKDEVSLYRVKVDTGTYFCYEEEITKDESCFPILST